MKRRRKQLSKEAEERRIHEINAAYHRCFTSTDGQKVLEHMIQQYYAIPIAQHSDTLLDVGERQGKANVVSDIYARMTANQ